ncbi:MAG TPA: CoA transferase [Acidimicrobiales bacterium]|nr:CoA transferase [Acidimicrobiales bacterium]
MTSGATSGPLAGVRVVDLSIAGTGPYAVAVMADQGADVVKVERPGLGDIGRWVGTAVNGVSALYQMCNRGKRGIAVDLAHPEGRDLVRALIERADVVVQNWRTGVAERLGLGYADVRRPELIYLSISGFGPTGPYAPKGAYDTVIQAYGGVVANEADRTTGEPRAVGQVLADKVTALTAVQAVTAALLARERGRGGQHIELSMLDAVVSFMWIDSAGNEVLRDGDGSQPGSFAPPSTPMRFVDGWGVVTPVSDADFAGTCRALGVGGYDDPRVATIAERRRHRDVAGDLMRRCREAASRLTTEQAMARLDAERVPCGVVLGPAELVEDPHARETGLFVELDHPTAGRVRQPRHPNVFHGTPAAVRGAAPALGQHTDEVLAELGVGPEATADLRARGVVA